ncbi:AGE family epimerase/isomerase [Labrenzia sp. OB1]|uniref:AGE family epimerase/isomerase n=1 Tax=Labrenzia sp. OB1 TaxID=1561204 RepID=UPI0007B1A961|nr:AGE family epimerase/isomerase [Labrenzia sp. OB1]KZM50194.1 N-acylglucosamine 2-epimerase [Labrenzia sp. OB1]
MTANDLTLIVETIRKSSEDLTGWLTEKALPVWCTEGANLTAGECFEAIDLETRRALPVPRRARIVPRQIYSFLEGAKLGWPGPAAELAIKLSDWHVKTFVTDAGYYASAADMENRITDSSFDLYNQAFALFGFACIASTVPDRRAAATAHADKLLSFLFENYRHSKAGFREANPDRAPLCSNPHMHLFEACRAWEAISEDPVWTDLSDEIAELALTRFIDPVNGGLREFFDLDWTPAPSDKGRVMEPGHQFEWAWLLAGWGQSRGDAGALVAARRLYDIGWTYGIDESRGVAFMALNDDFTVRDPVARLWGQTEWIKAAVAMAKISTGAEREAYLGDIPNAVQALQIYFKDVPAGLWHDKLTPEGDFVDEPAPASSLYHIVCAISELNAFAKSL